MILEEYGFIDIGKWVLSSKYKTTKHLSHLHGINFEILNDLKTNVLKTTKNMLYAFTVKDEILYLGETTAGLGSRFESYRYGMESKNDTDNTVKIGITTELQAGNDVIIWASSPEVEYQLDSGRKIKLKISKSLEYYLLQNYPTRLNKQHKKK